MATLSFKLRAAAAVVATAASFAHAAKGGDKITNFVLVLGKERASCALAAYKAGLVTCRAFSCGSDHAGRACTVVSPVRFGQMQVTTRGGATLGTTRTSTRTLPTTTPGGSTLRARPTSTPWRPAPTRSRSGAGEQRARCLQSLPCKLGAGLPAKRSGTVGTCPPAPTPPARRGSLASFPATQ